MDTQLNFFFLFKIKKKRKKEGKNYIYKNFKNKLFIYNISFNI